VCRYYCPWRLASRVETCRILLRIKLYIFWCISWCYYFVWYSARTWNILNPDILAALLDNGQNGNSAKWSSLAIWDMYCTYRVRETDVINWFCLIKRMMLKCFEIFLKKNSSRMFLLLFSDCLRDFITSTHCGTRHCGRFTPNVIGPFAVYMTAIPRCLTTSQARYKHIVLLSLRILDISVAALIQLCLRRIHMGMLKFRSSGIKCRAVR
jgi:hypothetical protein